jgi:hypothetical protein
MKSKDKVTPSSDPKTDAHCILLLSEAERNAKQIVESARKRKMALIKKARDESANELEIYRKESESNLSKIVKENQSTQTSDSVKFEKDLVEKKADLGNSFKTNSLKTLEFVLNKFNDIQVKSHENYLKEQ